MSTSSSTRAGSGPSKPTSRIHPGQRSARRLRRTVGRRKHAGGRSPVESSNATGINGNQNNTSATAAGAAYVYTRSGTTWTQQAYVKASNTGAGDRFGIAVALSSNGNTLAVGAYREDSNATGINGNQADNSATDSGAVYVFTRSGTTWSQQAYIKAPTPAPAISSAANSTAVAASHFPTTATPWRSARNEEDSNATGINGNQSDNSTTECRRGLRVHPLRHDAGVNRPISRRQTRTGVSTFGQAVALSGDGNTLAVVESAETSAPVVHRCRATCLLGPEPHGASRPMSRRPTRASDDYFGYSVSLSANGNMLAVGAKGEDSNATLIDGNQSDNSASDAGAVYRFSRVGSTWTQDRYIKASNTGASDTSAPA